jgi:hypothetical protein
MTEAVEPSAEEARGWLNQSAGKYFMHTLRVKLEDLKDDWANGAFTRDHVEASYQLNSEALGKVQQLADIILTLEEMTIDEEDEEMHEMS